MDPLFDAFDMQITDFLFTTMVGFLTIGGGWFGLALRTVLLNRDARKVLHSALYTGVDYVTDELADLIGDGVSRFSMSTIRLKLVDYVKGSAPDSVKRLKASDEQLERMAQARINDQLIRLRAIEG